MQVVKSKFASKLTALLLAAVLMVSMIPMAVSAESVSATTNADVNLRTGPGTDNAILTTVAEGSSITVTDRSNSAWFKVTSGSLSGYMSSQYIDIGSGSSGGSSGSYVTTATVNFRTGPSTSYESLTLVSEGTAVTVLDTSNGTWYKVRLSNGSEGYIHSDYLSGGGSSSGGSSGSSGGGLSETYETTAYVNVRTGPGTGNAVITTIDEGTKVTVTDKSNGGWYAVKLSDGRNGYISSQYLQASGSSSGGGGASVSEAYVTTAYVNMRTGPSTGNSIITTLDDGTKVTVIEKTNSSWYKVQLSSGATGYVHTDYLKAAGSSGSVPTPAPSVSETYAATAYVNVRSGPGTGNSVITTIDEGTKVTVTDKSNSEWYAVTLSSGSKGYISSQYLKKVDGTAPPSELPSESGDYMTTAYVNVRSGPSTNDRVLTTIDENTKVTLVEKTSSSWYKVKLSDGTVGYIYTQYLKAVSSSATPTPTPAPSTDKYMKTTADSGLNLRKTPGGDIITTLDYGTVVKVLEAPSSGWVKVQTRDGSYTGYVSTDYVTDYTPGAVSSISLSTDSASLSKYMTFYVEANVSDPSALVWTSDNESVATVKGGFIFGVGEGTATVTARDAYGTAEAKVRVTVTAPEAVRFAYTNSNVPAANESFNLVAVTDNEKTSVKFVIDGVGEYTTSDYTTETASTSGYADNTVRIFTTSLSLGAGSYSAKAYSSTGGGYSSSGYGFDIMVGGDKSAATTDTHRASDELIDILAGFEGFLKVITPDRLAYNIPTVGYGYVVNSNSTFYNNLTRTEAIAMLHDTVNEGVYTSSVNRFMQNNGIKINQAQFDALVSFTYNCGSGWIGDSTVSSLISNAVNYDSMSMPQSASILISTGVYSDYNGSKEIAKLKSEASIKVTDKYVDGNKNLWYKITSGSFSGSGWVRGGVVAFGGGIERNLNYIDARLFSTKLLEWHVAGGECVEGLLYRRLAEAKLFLYGNYAEASSSNGNYYENTYGFSYPDCMKGFE